MVNKVLITLSIGWLAWQPNPLQAASLTLAVASNFATTMQALIDLFEQQTKHRVRVSIGSTAKHYQQILQGAPFDAFFAANVEHPKRLQQLGRVIEGGRFSYAYGRLALLANDNTQPPLARLQALNFNYLAIANPKLAPYGQAAKQALQALHLWAQAKERMVFAQSVNQAFQFVHSKQAELGFVAYSQIVYWQQQDRFRGDYWLVPTNQHQPIEQQAAILTRRPAMLDFVRFLSTSKASKLISQAGYKLP